MSLASRWTLTPESSCPPGKTRKLGRPQQRTFCPGRPDVSNFVLEIRLVHESTHSDVIHDAQG